MAKIGLALSGGGARAFAHLGVISNLQWMGIPVNIISGTSMGAVVGAIHAGGLNLDSAKNLFLELSLSKVINPILPYYGLSNYEKIRKLFQRLGIPKTFEELKIPLVVSATDIARREPVFFNNGSLWDALFASLALPGLFYPVRIGDMLLVDGGLTVNLPVSVLRKDGADFVIASDVNTLSRAYPEVTNMFQVVYESVATMVHHCTRAERADADFVIDTDLDGIGILAFGRREEILNHGYKETFQQAKELKKLFEEKSYVQDRGLGPLFVGPLS